MRTLIISVAVLLATGLSTAAGDPRGYVWSRIYDGTVQYGVPDTDDRALRIDCAHGRLEIGGFSASDAADGSSVPITFSGRGFSERLTAKISECDGACFSTAAKPNDAAIQALLAGGSLKIEHAGETWTVPGQGAPGVLRPLLKACGLSAGG